MRKQKKKQRKALIKAREDRWIAHYEANMQKVLGDPSYRLPNA